MFHNYTSKTRIAAVSAALAGTLMAAALSAHAQSTLTIPNSTIASTSSYPLGAGTSREQYFYASSLFSGITTPITITSITFDGTLSNAATTSQTASLTLLVGSTTINPTATANSVAGVSTTFANNLSPTGSQTTSTSYASAFSSSSTALTAALVSGTQYTTTLIFSNPYTYDPTSGEALLLDFSSTFSFFREDTSTSATTSASRLYPGNATTGTYDNSSTDIFTLNYTTGTATTPEPNALALLVLPAVGMAYYVLQSRRIRA